MTGTLAWIAWAIPIDAGMAIVLWIGMMIVAQAFQATPREHAPAVVVGLLPGIGAWGALMAKNGLRAAGLGDAGPVRSPRPSSASSRRATPGFRAPSRSSRAFSSPRCCSSAAVVGVIERRWVVAAGWCAIAAALSATGLMHSYQWTIADTTLKLRPAWPFVIGYSAMALSFFAARWLTEEAAH